MWTQSCGPHNDGSCPGPVAGKDDKCGEVMGVVYQGGKYCKSGFKLISVTVSVKDVLHLSEIFDEGQQNGKEGQKWNH